MERQIELLKSFDNQIDHYLPIDVEDRDEWLIDINLLHGLKLKTDWPIIGKHEGELLSLTDEEERRVESWMKDKFFNSFGYK